eukprot:15364605-Ditylum_brightwellii.AAC.1
MKKAPNIGTSKEVNFDQEPSEATNITVKTTNLEELEQTIDSIIDLNSCKWMDIKGPFKVNDMAKYIGGEDSEVATIVGHEGNSNYTVQGGSGQGNVFLMLLKHQNQKKIFWMYQKVYCCNNAKT